MDFFNYKRRKTVNVEVGNIIIGSDYPIVIQTMTSTDTLNTKDTIEQCVKIINSKGDLIRLTAQGVKEAENLKNIKENLENIGYKIPLSADIHFNPKAANVSAKYVEKVRINPGNFMDKQKKFAEKNYTEQEYKTEIEKIKNIFIPFINICKENKTSIRIGVNHGSLSDRIVTKYGDTPEGMVESCMEYLRIAIEENFKNVVISIKSSNTLLMTKSVRLLVYKMKEENIYFPLHLGVTEAGNGEDGRIKSAVGIGALLSDGIGDTIRVSLSEDPELEIPVARKLSEYIKERENHKPIFGKVSEDFSQFSTSREVTNHVRNIGGNHLPIVISDRSKNIDTSIDIHFIPDFIYVGSKIPDNFKKGMKAIIDYDNYKKEIDKFPLFNIKNIDKIDKCDTEIKFVLLSYLDLSNDIIDFINNNKKLVIILTTNHINKVGEIRAALHKLKIKGCKTPIVIHNNYDENDLENLQIKSASDFGTIFLDGFGNGLMISNKGNIDSKKIDSLGFGILQASRIRTSKTEFISCPSCGRTLFDLQNTVHLIQKSFSHLKHLKIAIMGCIVNGPGEMADADYGYVGSEPHKVSLYKKKECIKRNIPTEQAVDNLISIIKENGDWIDP